MVNKDGVPAFHVLENGNPVNAITPVLGLRVPVVVVGPLTQQCPTYLLPVLLSAGVRHLQGSDGRGDIA